MAVEVAAEVYECDVALERPFSRFFFLFGLGFYPPSMPTLRREIAGLMKRLLTIIVPQLMVNWWLIVVNRVSYGGLIGFSDPC